MKKNLKTLLGYLLEGETVSERPFMLSLDNLVAHRNSLYDAYDHCVYRNRCSKTSGPIVVVEIGDGKYQLIDGYHRLVEHLLLRGGEKGEKPIPPIEAILGGIGSDQYAIASSEGRDRWVGNSSLKHGNLEDLFGGSEEEINGMIDDSVEKIRNARQLNDKTAKRGDLFENGIGGGSNKKKLLLLVHPDIVFEPGNVDFIRRYIDRLREHMRTFDYVITHKFFSDAAPELIDNIGKNIDLWNELMEVLEAESDWIKRDYKFSASFKDALPDYLIENEGTEIWLGGGYEKLCVEDTRKSLLKNLGDIIDETGASIAGCYAPLIVRERHRPSFGDSPVITSSDALRECIRMITENEIKNSSKAIWYHTTSRENAEKILREGLRINPSGKGKSRGSLDWMPEAYGGITPIFLSRKPGRYVNGVVLRVDVSGLGLVADIPGLVDFDGRLTDHSVYWDEEETPEIIWDLMDPETGESVNGELEFEWLREPGNDISGAAIELTGTAAVMEDIAPSRIELTDMIVENVNEAMKTMPPWTYYVEISGDQRVIYIKIKSEARGRPKYIGIIKIERSISVPPRGTVWEVSNVEADEGYGPMLYDLAMEMVYLLDDVGLMPDRTFVSPSARAVWAKYYNRGDINKEPLPEDMFDFSDMRNRPDYMRYYYSKSGTPLMDSLKAKELVKSEDFYLD